MFYEPRLRNHGLRHDPFKALVVPRPIGWIGTVDADGRPNLAPYSFFNAVADRPPMVVFSSAGRKHSVANIEQTGEFTCSLAGYGQRAAMNMTSATVAAGVDEFALAGLEPEPSLRVKPPWVKGDRRHSNAGCGASSNCRRPDPERGDAHRLVIGEVIGIHVVDSYIREVASIPGPCGRCRGWVTWTTPSSRPRRSSP